MRGRQLPIYLPIYSSNEFLIMSNHIFLADFNTLYDTTWKGYYEIFN